MRSAGENTENRRPAAAKQPTDSEWLAEDLCHDAERDADQRRGADHKDNPDHQDFSPPLPDERSP